MKAQEKLELYRNIIGGDYSLVDSYSFDVNNIYYALTISGQNQQIIVTKTVRTNAQPHETNYAMCITDQTTGRRIRERNTHTARIIFNATKSMDATR